MPQKLTNNVVNKLPSKDKRYEVWDTEVKGLYVKILPSGGKAYYFFYRAEGRKRHFLLGKHGNITAPAAREAAIEKTGEIAKGADIQAVRQEKRQQEERQKNNTLGKFIDNRYQSWIEVERKSGREAIKTLQRKFPHLMARPMSQITAWDIEQFKTAELNKGLKASTVNRVIKTLQSCLSTAVKWGAIEQHPLHNISFVKENTTPRIRYLDQQETRQLRTALEEREAGLRAARVNANKWREARKLAPYPAIKPPQYADHLKPIVLLALNTGMRRGEIMHLEWHSVNFDKAVITIKAEIAKSGKERHIPINSEAMAMLKQWREQTTSKGFAFINPKTGRPFTEIKNSWEGVVKKAGITNLRFHDLRHDFASKLVMAGVDLNTVRELLGHSDFKLTLKYAHLAPEHKAQAVELLTQGQL